MFSVLMKLHKKNVEKKKPEQRLSIPMNPGLCVDFNPTVNPIDPRSV